MFKGPLQGRDAVSYARWSSGRQATGSSLERQNQRAIEYCAKEGMTLLTSVVDSGVSAFTGDNLNAGLGRFIESVRDGTVSSSVVLLIENLDRFSRMNPMDVLPAFTSALDTGLTIVTLHDGRIHTRDVYRANIFHLMQSLMSMQLAHEESKKKSERGKGAWDARVNKLKAGQRVPISKVPFWIDQKTQKLNDRADDARQIFQLAVEGSGASAITRIINERNIPSSRGGTWGKSMVQSVLKSKAAYGAYILGDHEQLGYFEPLISESAWLAIENRARRQRRNPQTATDANIFSRLLYCGGCGAPMSVTTTTAGGKRYKYASCSMRTAARNGCTAPNWPYEPFEALFVDRMAHLLEDTQAQPLTASEPGERERLQVQLESLEARMESAVQSSIDTNVETVRRMYLRSAETLDGRIAATRYQLGELAVIEQEREGALAVTVGVISALKEARRMRRENRPLLKHMVASVVRKIHLQPFDREDINVAEVELRSGGVNNMVFEDNAFG
jgi:DNA invertase Pin-like site-specific DNA recombinase